MTFNSSLPPTLLIGGVQSGSGKTSFTLALLQAWAKEGKRVQSFKAGPDFLDPLWHQAVTGRPSYNLDTQMMGPAACQAMLSQGAGADLAIIEGVMGLFDGKSGVGGPGSSLDLAKTLGVKVLLVVNAQGMAGSLVPLAQGFKEAAEGLGARLGGVLANRVGGASHAGLLQELLREARLPPLLAWLEKGAPTLGERHLGLKTPEEAQLPDLSSALHLLPGWESAWTRPKAFRPVLPAEALLPGRRVAIARDQACSFIYPANLDWLKAQGAKLTFFSPLAGEPLPPHSEALWLPGGYPELYGERLSKSASWSSVKAFIESGGHALAECGGMMLLGESLRDLNNKSWPLMGLLPFYTTLQTRLAALGYRESRTGARGHEFHHSKRLPALGGKPAFDLDKGDQGIQYKNLRAGYVHWYFPSAPHSVARWFGKE